MKNTHNQKNKSKGKLYFPITDFSIWTGRIDALSDEYLYQQVKFLDLTIENNSHKDYEGYALIGFQTDEGVRRNLGNQGAVDGPITLRKILAKMPVHSHFELYDTGNIKCIDGDLEAAQYELKCKIATIMSLGLTPIVIGGGHEIAFGHYQGIYQHYDKNPVAILNFDAHFDLRPLVDGKGSSGTPFSQINDFLKSKNQPFDYYCAGIQPFANTKSLFNYAKTNKVKYQLAEKINTDPSDLSFIKSIMNKHDRIYVTICLDVFQASIAPGVSAPQPFGICSEYVVNALRLLKAGNKVVSLDIAELAPNYDSDNITAKLASCILLEYLHAD